VMRRNYRRRLDRLERLGRAAQTPMALLPQVRPATNPKAAALREELNKIAGQIRTRLTPTGDAADDHPALRQALLRDDRACAVACPLAEVEAGLQCCAENATRPNRRRRRSWPLILGRRIPPPTPHCATEGFPARAGRGKDGRCRGGSPDLVA
jgi:hypothetical protein